MRTNHLPKIIRLIPSRRTVALPTGADVPITHFRRLSNDAWNALLFFRKHMKAAHTYDVVKERHEAQLRRMVLLSLVEAFERYLKELAAVCVDAVAVVVPDDRLDKIALKSKSIATHFAGRTLGRALCESMTWLDCKEVNDRFRLILSRETFASGNFYIFPKSMHQPAALRGHFETVQVIFQLRHMLVHNAGVVTASDAMKLRLFGCGEIESPSLLEPALSDVWAVKHYLQDVVEKSNKAVADELSALLTTFLASDAGLFDPGTLGPSLRASFNETVTICGVAY